MPQSELDKDASATAGGNLTTVTLVTDSLEKPLRDKRAFRLLVLENSLEVLLVHDPDTDKASAAMDVNVGYFSDEPEIPGMRHAIEHTLPKANGKFTTKGEYEKYVSSNSGTCRAITGPTWANYHFDICPTSDSEQVPSESDPSPLYNGLHQFSQSFISPSFDPQVFDEEVVLIDSENTGYSQVDAHRWNHIIRSLSNPSHPFSRFFTGTLETLKTIPEARGINVRDKLVEIHAKEYSANRMKLVVLGREPIPVLQKWVSELFSPIVNHNIAPDQWLDTPLFRQSDLGTQCFVKPIGNLKRLVLYFPLIDEELMFGAQPSQHLGHLIGHESPGSILSYIHAKGWAGSLDVSNQPVCSGAPTVLVVNIGLTSKGLKMYHQIVKVFFRYISMLKEQPSQEWYFQERKRIADINFEWEEKSKAFDFARRVSQTMRGPLPRKWLLSGALHPREFLPDQIEQALDKIRPDNFIMLVVSKECPNSWIRDKWYGVEHYHEKIPNDIMKDFEKAVSISPEDRVPELHMPRPNPFIPSSLEVIEEDTRASSSCPRVLRSDSNARTWWKFSRCQAPRAHVMVSLVTPLVYASAENMVMARMFLNLVKDSLKEPTYQPDLAGLEYELAIDPRSLFLKVRGYTPNLLALLETVVTRMRDFDLKEHSFNSARNCYISELEDMQLRPPHDQTDDYLNWLNAHKRYFPVDGLIKAATSVVFSRFKQFQSELLGRLFIEVFAIGNIRKEYALKATSIVESILSPQGLPESQWPIPQSLIPKGGSNHVLKGILKNTKSSDHCIETWFYLGEKGNREIHAKALLLFHILPQAALLQLRSTEGLGYYVFCGPREFWTTYGFRFLIQSAWNPGFLDSRIEAFLMGYAGTLEKMSDREFEGHKQSLLISQLELNLDTLDKEFKYYWDEILYNRFDFECSKLNASQIELLTKAEVMVFFNQHLNPTSSQRARLSIHLTAQDNTDGVDKRQEDAQKKADEEPSSGDAVETAKEITDARFHITNLTASSRARPIKDTSEYE